MFARSFKAACCTRFWGIRFVDNVHSAGSLCSTTFKRHTPNITSSLRLHKNAAARQASSEKSDSPNKTQFQTLQHQSHPVPEVPILHALSPR